MNLSLLSFLFNACPSLLSLLQVGFFKEGGQGAIATGFVVFLICDMIKGINESDVANIDFEL